MKKLRQTQAATRTAQLTTKTMANPITSNMAMDKLCYDITLMMKKKSVEEIWAPGSTRLLIGT